MKTQNIAISRIAVLVLFYCFVSADVYAEAIISDPTDRPSNQTKEQSLPLGTAITGAGNSTPIRKKPDSHQKMTCWQYGKLLFEQTILQPKDKMENIQILQNPETGSRMYLFDFKTAFCLIK